MRISLLLIIAAGLALVSCAPPKNLDEAQKNVDATVAQGKAAAGKAAEDAVAKGREAASGKIEEAQKWATQVSKDKKLSPEAKAWIEKTIKDSNGTAAAASTVLIETAMEQVPNELGWLKVVVEDKVRNSKGDAQAAWNMLLERIKDKKAEQDKLKK
jgi:hypothetical protein